MPSTDLVKLVGYRDVSVEGDGGRLRMFGHADVVMPGSAVDMGALAERMAVLAQRCDVVDTIVVSARGRVKHRERALVVPLGGGRFGFESLEVGCD